MSAQTRRLIDSEARLALRFLSLAAAAGVALVALAHLAAAIL